MAPIDVLSPADARALVDSKHMPHPTGALLSALGYEYVSTLHLPESRPAITWRDRGLVKVRPAREEIKRAALAHELAHICLGHSAAIPWRCEYRAWDSPHREERDADGWLLDYLLPEQELIAWIEVGRGLRLTRVAEMAVVPITVARRQLKRLDLLGSVWDDTTARADHRSHPFFAAASGSR